VCDEYSPVATGGIDIFTRSLAELLAERCHGLHAVAQYSVAFVVREVVHGVLVTRWPLLATVGVIAGRLAMERKLQPIAADCPIDVLGAPEFEGASGRLPRCGRDAALLMSSSLIHRVYEAHEGVEPILLAAEAGKA
jgi:hypothetical protein